MRRAFTEPFEDLAPRVRAAIPGRCWRQRRHQPFRNAPSGDDAERSEGPCTPPGMYLKSRGRDLRLAQVSSSRYSVRPGSPLHVWELIDHDHHVRQGDAIGAGVHRTGVDRSKAITLTSGGSWIVSTTRSAVSGSPSSNRVTAPFARGEAATKVFALPMRRSRRGFRVVGLALTSTDCDTLVSTSPRSRVTSPMFPYFTVMSPWPMAMRCFPKEIDRTAR